MIDFFYRAFEDKYRGSKELIKSRLQVYLPFIKHLLKANPAGKVLDLGCGRGEWLELLGEHGFLALGVDLDDGMLQACLEKNLNVEKADAIAYLQGLPESSLYVVSGFHLAEHLPFEVLRRLVQEALRVLVPGGLLILETPNPENITVGSNSFYLDFTHQRPLPLGLLSFLTEYYGFARVKVMRLQENERLHSDKYVSLMDVLSGASPDYAVVAQKQGAVSLMEELNPVFDKDYGLSLYNLAQRHDRRLTAIEAKAEQFQAALDKNMAQLQAVYNSSSWRITAPLRWLKQKVKAIITLRKRVQEKKNHFKTILNKKNLPYRKLLVDISSLIQQDHGTGIQRVTRTILKNWLLNPPLGFKIEPVYATVDKSYRYATISKNFFLDEAIKPHLNDEPISINSRDIFLGLDLSHATTIMYQTLLKYLHKNRVDIRFVVYDLLPIQFPDFFEKQHSIHSMKAKWLSVVTNLSGAICISKTVAEDLAVWMKKNSKANQRNFNINWFHLGADIDKSLPTNGLLQNEQLNLDNLISSTTFLMVGTLEPRKGHAQVLDAFEKLWQDGADIKLIIVGKKGWLVDSLLIRLQKHMELGKRLFWVKDASDEFLVKIYASCTCLIAASYAEGFGLPLIEAAKYKLPIICRDIPIFREVAGEHAYYFKASNGDELAHSIQQWLDKYRINIHPKSDHMPYLTWKQSADMLLNILK